MSEHLSVQTPEVASEAPATNQAAERHTAQPEIQPADQLEAIRQNIEAASKNTHVETDALKSETPASPKPTYVNKELKAVALRRSLQHVQHNLPAPQRLLSKVVHQPAIRRASAATGQTIARPSGLLGGGLCAFLGSLLYLYLAKHVGFTYNYLLFIFFFGGGFVIGLLLELAARLLAGLRAKRL